MARRPLAGAAALFVLGVSFGLCTGRWQAAACGWVITAAGWLAVRRVSASAQGQGIVVMLLAFATGWLAAGSAAAQRSSEAAWLDRLAGGCNRLTLVGTVSGDVESQPLAHGGVRRKFALRQVSIVTADDTRRISSVPVSITWYGPSAGATNAAGALRPVPASGEVWEFSGRLRVQRLGALRKVRASLQSREKEATRRAEASLRDWGTLADRARQVTATRLVRGIETWGPIPTLVQAMFLGTRSTIPRELNQVFRDSGTIHIFAISGMNVAILAVVLTSFLSLFGVPRPFWCLPLAPILIFYTVLAGLSASALRACLMAILYFGAPLLGRKPDGVSTLAAAAVIGLAIDPFQLQDAGFGLSFACMLGLLLIYHPVSAVLQRWWRVDDAALEARAGEVLGGELDPQVVQRRTWRVRLLRHASELLAASLAAWMASTPLTAWYFGRVTPAGLLANLPIEPAAFLAGVASGVSLVVGLFCPPLAALLNNAAGGLTLLMIWVARVTVAIPGGTLTVPKPELWQVGCWYAAIFLLTWWLWRLARRPAEGAKWMRGEE